MDSSSHLDNFSGAVLVLLRQVSGIYLVLEGFGRNRHRQPFHIPIFPEKESEKRPAG